VTDSLQSSPSCTPPPPPLFIPAGILSLPPFSVTHFGPHLPRHLSRSLDHQSLRLY
jgi:hypothetical protein